MGLGGLWRRIGYWLVYVGVALIVDEPDRTYVRRVVARVLGPGFRLDTWKAIDRDLGGGLWKTWPADRRGGRDSS